MTIGDSGAYSGGEGVDLPQHQAALTILDTRLSSPDCITFRWLDLACGRGQMIASLDQSLSAEARARIEFWAYDINLGYVRETVELAQRLGFGHVEAHVGELNAIGQLIPTATSFDFITLTNTLHETAPRDLPALIGECISRLTANGVLYLYDFENLPSAERELGSVAWSKEHIADISRAILSALGASPRYEPIVHRWSHRSRKAWSLVIERQHVGVSQTSLEASVANAISEGKRVVHTMLDRRLDLCRSTLESLTRTGAETADERDQRIGYLFEFWALTRATRDWP